MFYGYSWLVKAEKIPPRALFDTPPFQIRLFQKMELGGFITE
jgi:hypothetical protein